jgi:hypothetical protein
MLSRIHKLITVSTSMNKSPCSPWPKARTLATWGQVPQEKMLSRHAHAPRNLWQAPISVYKREPLPKVSWAYNVEARAPAKWRRTLPLTTIECMSVIIWQMCKPQSCKESTKDIKCFSARVQGTMVVSLRMHLTQHTSRKWSLHRSWAFFLGSAMCTSDSSCALSQKQKHPTAHLAAMPLPPLTLCQGQSGKWHIVLVTFVPPMQFYNLFLHVADPSASVGHNK